MRRAAGQPRRLIAIAGWAIALDTLRVGWLWVALHAVGARASVDVTVETYGLVALLGTISILPAGLGVVDAGLVATLHHSGLALTTAMAGVLLYRVAELWVPLAAGARPALAAARGPRRRGEPAGARGASVRRPTRSAFRGDATGAAARRLPAVRRREAGAPWPHRAS